MHVLCLCSIGIQGRRFTVAGIIQGQEREGGLTHCACSGTQFEGSRGCASRLPSRVRACQADDVFVLAREAGMAGDEVGTVEGQGSWEGNNHNTLAIKAIENAAPHRA